jgi:DNA-binding transcriptional LysR family regulator
MGRVDLSSLNLNLLVALEALLRERSVTEAARRAHVTPSAMSHSLAELRVLLGDALLVRSGRAMVLSARAERMLAPLQRLLADAQRLIEDKGGFDPNTAERHFVIAAPDFLAALLLPRLFECAARVAPRVTLETVPSTRRGNAWLLESGEVDLALGAIVADAPAIRRMYLCTEGFACAARKSHPRLRKGLSLAAYVELPHLVITLGDNDRPTWIDEALAKLGRTRHVAVRVRYFMAAPLVVAESDLIMTGPRMLLEYFAKRVPIQIHEPPLRLPTYPEEAYWHERFDSDPAHRWLRDLVKSVTSTLGQKSRPERTTWDERPVRGSGKS